MEIELCRSRVRISWDEDIDLNVTSSLLEYLVRLTKHYCPDFNANTHRRQRRMTRLPP